MSDDFRTSSVDMRCGVCRRPVFYDDKSKTLLHWDPKQDKDHEATGDMSNLTQQMKPVKEKRWYQK
jgi:hypothetical protein